MTVATRRLAAGPLLSLLLIWVALLAMMGPTLTAPLLEMHSWRQADTASFARGLARGEFDLLHPRFLAYYPDAYGIDGATESEFNFYPWLVSLGMRLFGEHDWVSRAVSLAFALLAATWTYLLGRLLLDDLAALLGGLMMALSPLFVFYGRSVQPDIAALALALGGLYCFVRWTRSERWGWYLCSLVMMALALLTKVTMLFAGFALLAAAWCWRGGRLFCDWRVWLYAAGVLLPMVAYYAYARGLYYQTGLTVYGLTGGWPGSGKFDSLGQLLSGDFYRVLFARLRSVILTPYVLVLAGLGLWLSPRRDEWPLYAWMVGMAVFVLAAAQGNRQHEYYQLPPVPIACLFAGKGLSAIMRPGAIDLDLLVVGRRLGMVVALVALLLSVRSAQAQLPTRLAQEPVLAEVAAATAAYTPADAPVAIIHDWARVPEVFYYADRRGWSLWIERDAQGRYGRLIVAERVREANGWRVDELLEDDIARLELLRSLGASSVVVSLEKGSRAAFEAGPIGQQLAQRYRLVAAGEHWLVFDLASHPE
jgi:hypothetical protein